MTSEPQRKRRSNAHNRKLSDKNRRKKAWLRLSGLFVLLVGTFATATVFTSNKAIAGECEDFLGNPIPGCSDIPEISALEGTAALAVIAATLLIVWERRRRAA